MDRKTRKLVAILFADIVGYTSLIQKDESNAIFIIEKFKTVLEQHIPVHGGKIVQYYGDGCLATFDSALDGVQCAMQLQKKFRTDIHVPARIGLHQGDVLMSGNNIFGASVNIASRIESAGVEGSVLFSKTVRDQIKNKSLIKTKSLGSISFKNVDEPVDVFAVVNNGFVFPDRALITGKITKDQIRDRNSILVLPFENLVIDDKYDYFSDGLTEDIITDLSRVQALTVMSRGSSMKLKNTDFDINTLKKEFDIQYILEGSIRKDKRGLRIVTKLTEISSNSIKWAERYKGQNDDVFEFQEQVARSVAKALEIKLSSREEEQLKERPIPDFAAYDYYLRARREIYRFEEKGLKIAMQYLDEAIKIAGEKPLLLYGKGWATFQMVNSGISNDPSLLDKAESYARRILAINKENTKGLLLLGMCSIKEDFRIGIRHWRKAYLLEPKNPDILLWLGVHSLSTGQTQFASTLINELVRIEPLEPLSHCLAGYTAFFDGRHHFIPDAISQGLEIGDPNPMVLWCSIRCLAAVGEIEKALALVDKIQKENGGSFIAKACSLFGSALRGNVDTTDIEENPGILEWARGDAEWAQFFSDAFALGGRYDLAISWLELANAKGFINYPFLAYYNPFLLDLRTQERFKSLMRKIEIEWREFEGELSPY
jgi:TolB-like protein